MSTKKNQNEPQITIAERHCKLDALKQRFSLASP